MLRLFLLILRLLTRLSFGFLCGLIGRILSSLLRFFSHGVLLLWHILRRLVLFRRFWWLTSPIIAFYSLARRLCARVSSVTRRWICTGACSYLSSFAACHGARAVRAPLRITTVYRADLCVARLFLSGWPFAGFAAEHGRWVVALPCSNSYSSATRFVALRESAPVAEFAIDRADSQKARLLIVIRAESVAIFAVFSRWWLFASAVAHLDAFTTLLSAITPYSPLSVTSIHSRLGVLVISSKSKKAQSHGKAKRRQKPSRTHDRRRRICLTVVVVVYFVSARVLS